MISRPLGVGARRGFIYGEELLLKSVEKRPVWQSPQKSLATCTPTGFEAASLCAAAVWLMAVACPSIVIGSSVTAHAQTVGTAGLPQTPPRLAIELNKLETYDKGCRAYVVINNPSTVAYQSVKLDLVLFQPDGVIGKRIAVDLAPLKPSKKTVKLFDLEGMTCDRVASVLVNDVIDCKADSGPIADCVSTMAFTSVAPAPLTTR